MLYRTLGRTGVKVSEIGLGCEHLQGKDYETVKTVIDAAADSGVNILDVFMSEPQVRTDIGKAIQGRREQFIIQGHICAGWKDGQYTRTRDTDECRFFFDDLLNRLQTDYIDIGMIHFVDTNADFDAVFNSDVITYAVSLKEKGIIRALGISSHNADVAKRAVETGLMDVLMFSVNPAYDLMPPQTDINNLFTTDMLDKNTVNGMDQTRTALYNACVQHGCAITVMKTFCGGMLLNADISPFKKALTPRQCIHFALTRPAVASVLIGCVTPEEVRHAAAYTAEDGDNDFTEIFAVKPEYAAHGMCVYCNHCLPCPAMIDIAQVNKYLDLTASGKVPATVAAHYNTLDAHAGDCTECGSCEGNCPFGVPVRERMTKAKEVFGQ